MKIIDITKSISIFILILIVAYLYCYGMIHYPMFTFVICLTPLSVFAIYHGAKYFEERRKNK